MKRSPLKRKKRAAVKRKARPFSIAAEVNRLSNLPHSTNGGETWVLVSRKPIPRVGKRAERDKAAIVAFRETVMDRCGDYCERCGCRVGRDKIEAHHLVRRSRCVGWFLKHDPAFNGAGVCFSCHRTLDLDPMDVGGPLEGESRRAHAAFQEWRAGNGNGR